MTTYFIKSVSVAFASIASVALLGACGGGGSQAEPGDILPIGSTLNMTMDQGTNASPYILSITVTGNNYGSVQWKSKTSASGSIAFTFVREGDKAVFKTSFYYAEGTFIIPGPVIVTPYVWATVIADLQLPAELDQQSFQKPFSGAITNYAVGIDPSTQASEPAGTFYGTGTYSIQPTTLN